MRFLLVLIAVAFAGCGGSSEPEKETAVEEEMETAADDLQESIETTLEKAEGVEDTLQEAADELDKAIDEAS